MAFSALRGPITVVTFIATQCPVSNSYNQRMNRFDAQVTPESYVIDSAGIIRYHGSIDDNQNPDHIKTQRLRLALDAVLAGKRVRRQARAEIYLSNA